jgi:hypothetical protein
MKLTSTLSLTVLTTATCVLSAMAFQPLVAQSEKPNRPRTQVLHNDSAHHSLPNLKVVSDKQWNEIDRAVDRGLFWLSRQQLANGSFPTRSSGNPGVTSLCIMSFLSRGHLPGSGPYGQTLDRALDFVLSCQLPNGVFTAEAISQSNTSSFSAAHSSVYNTTIAGLMLGELYGLTDAKRATRIQPAIQKTLDYMHKLQDRQISPQYALDRGGWRYLQRTSEFESDLSVTAWQIMFMRSAVNAGFEVPQNRADMAIEYVKRNFERNTGRFYYSFYKTDELPRAMAGAGVLCLFLAGQYDNEIEQKSGSWMLSQSFAPYNRQIDGEDHYHYAAYYVSQSMFQLGGSYWEQFYPEFSAVFVGGQNTDGSWDPESGKHSIYSNCYSSALAILALTPPYQLLPIYQR